jgi:hypothetical protein
MQMKAEIIYTGKLGGMGASREVEATSERGALSIASRDWTYGCGDIVVYVDGRRRERRFWSQPGRWELCPWTK